MTENEIKTYHSGDFDKSLKEYKYQPVLTKKLDALNRDFDDNLINEIALWKVDRYFQLPSELLMQVNQLQGFAPGEHRNATEVIDGLLLVPGVDIAMASTILRFRNPDVFQIIDKRAYRVVYGEPLKLYHATPKLKKKEIYFEYLDELIRISENRKIPFRDLDRILYQLDIEINKNQKL